ncbi:MAG: EAL domain-containing protein [Coriobacteriales bacterium]|nr:EAL domain-containing protein [Coriobacteriales bacterium]
MWDYSFMAPCVLVMLTLFIMYVSSKRLRIRFNRIFLELLGIQSLVIVLDIVSSKMDESYELFSTPSLYLINMLFFVAYFVRIFWFTRFTWALLSLNPREHRTLALLKYLPLAIALVICLSSVFTGAVFSIQDGMFQRGPWYNLLAITYLYYISYSVALISHYSHDVRPRDYNCALGYNLSLFAGTAVRLLLPRLLVMDTFCVIAILIIYLAFANPDLYLADNGLVFNIRGFTTLMSEQELQRNYYVLGFSLRNYAHERSIVGRATMRGVIERICAYLVETCEAGVTPFYLRGGRFVLLGTKDADWAGIRSRIDKRFSQPWIVDKSALQLDPSFVHVDSSTNGETASAVMSNLIIALDDSRQGSLARYTNSGTGTLNVSVIDQQIEVMRALEYALKHQTVEVYLQPILNDDMQTLAGAEALARIWDENGQIIPPGLFIPIAEKSGYIHELGSQVFRKTCEFVRDNDIAALGLQWVNVNLSPMQCLHNDLAEQLDQIRRECDVPAELIHLEITEESMIDYALLERQISKLQENGFKFVLDDYGTGYSNLTRVKHYPFITIKLDMEVVWDYFEERDNLLPVLVQGFKQQGLSITAEGVESADMAALLAEIGCDYLQGYYFCKPVPQEEFLARYSV